MGNVYIYPRHILRLSPGPETLMFFISSIYFMFVKLLDVMKCNRHTTADRASTTDAKHVTSKEHHNAAVALVVVGSLLVWLGTIG